MMVEHHSDIAGGMETRQSKTAQEDLRSILWLSASFAVLKLAIQIIGNVLAQHAGYGIFRDELYYLVCGRHLAFGYVDQPPLVALQASLSETLFGHGWSGEGVSDRRAVLGARRRAKSGGACHAGGSCWGSVSGHRWIPVDELIRSGLLDALRFGAASHCAVRFAKRGSCLVDCVRSERRARFRKQGFDSVLSCGDAGRS